MSGLEVELKFLIDPADWPRILAVLPEGHIETRALSASYFDTSDRTIQACGLTLRLREGDGVVTQTVKRGIGPIRTEIEAPRPDGRLDLSWPILKDALRGHPRGEPGPLFSVVVNRQIQVVRSGESEIELAFDHGTISAGALQDPVHELELELRSGHPRDLFRLAATLSEAAPLWLSLQQKAGRGYRLANGQDAHQALSARPVQLERGMRLKEAWRTVALAAMDQILTNAALLRQDSGPSALHQFRVGLRRYKAARSTFRDALKAGPDQPLPEVFGGLSRLCGQARDLDVLMERGDPPPALVAASTLARDQVRAAVSSPDFRQLVLAMLESLVCSDPADPATDDHGVRHHARRILTRRRRRLEAVGDDITGLDDATRHGLRIAAKPLRYAAEGFAGLFGEPVTQRYIRRLTQLQDALGVLNDRAEGLRLGQSLGLASPGTDAMARLRDQEIKDAQAAWKRLRSTPGFW